MSIEGTVTEGARGLALIMYNTYMHYPPGPGNGQLPNTKRDQEAMEETFKSLKFDTLVLPNANKDKVSEVIDKFASYPKYPKKYNCFAIYFSGHGDAGSMLSANDEDFNFEKVILQRFNKKLNRNVSERITKVPILVFIDACKGGDHPRRTVPKVLQKNKVSLNVLVAYATAEGYIALDKGGGVWTQNLAGILEKSEKTILETLDDVKQKMPADYFPEALPVTWRHEDSNVGDFKLRENLGKLVYAMMYSASIKSCLLNQNN